MRKKTKLMLYSTLVEVVVEVEVELGNNMHFVQLNTCFASAQVVALLD